MSDLAMSNELVPVDKMKMEVDKKEKKKKDKKEKKKRKRERDMPETEAIEIKRKKEKKKRKKEKKQDGENEKKSNGSRSNATLSEQGQSEALSPTTSSLLPSTCTRVVLDSAKSSTFPYKYILAPMVGASELAFRLLCRKYGADLCYTPMMSAHSFATDPSYREAEFQTCPQDRPLACHFCANRPQDFAAAVRLAAPYCDAIDLNLGCPQRTAYIGHFGSYLLDPKDRQLVCDIIRAGVAAASAAYDSSATAASFSENKIKKILPICCKIRLLDTIEETIQLCQQLQEAGVSWIAVHARYRASWERRGPGARDGPALLDQVRIIKQHVTIPIIANGNVITFQDVLKNLELTEADAVMSAEGMLDNPALFLPRLGSRPDAVDKTNPTNAVPNSTTAATTKEQKTASLVPDTTSSVASTSTTAKTKRKLEKRLREIKKLEEKRNTDNNLTKEELEKVARKEEILQSLGELADPSTSSSATIPTSNNIVACNDVLVHSEREPAASNSSGSAMSTMALAALYENADDRFTLANEYLSLVRLYPVKIRSVVFHIRRMLKDDLVRYQLMEDLLASETVDQIQDNILRKMESYMKHPDSFVFDRQKAKQQKEALERKKIEEGKRKAYEARMIRKAKREGREDHNYYLNIGAAVPTLESLRRFKAMHNKGEVMEAWKKDHSQHCMSFHLVPDGCKRGRACAFLHVDANSFVEGDEVAG